MRAQQVAAAAPGCGRAAGRSPRRRSSSAAAAVGVRVGGDAAPLVDVDARRSASAAPVGLLGRSRSHRLDPSELRSGRCALGRRSCPACGSAESTARYAGTVASRSRVGADRGDHAVREQRHPVGERDRATAGAPPAARWCRAAPGRSASSTSASVCTSSAESGSSSTSSARLAEHRPGQREPLALPAGEGQALLADPGGQPPRQVVRRSRPGPRASASRDLVVGRRPGGRG